MEKQFVGNQNLEKFLKMATPPILTGAQTLLVKKYVVEEHLQKLVKKSSWELLQRLSLIVLLTPGIKCPNKDSNFNSCLL
jgi:hypothetical protein